jgi:hypothetical protein
MPQKNRCACACGAPKKSRLATLAGSPVRNVLERRSRLAVRNVQPFVPRAQSGRSVATGWFARSLPPSVGRSVGRRRGRPPARLPQLLHANVALAHQLAPRGDQLAPLGGSACHCTPRSSARRKGANSSRSRMRAETRRTAAAEASERSAGSAAPRARVQPPGAGCHSHGRSGHAAIATGVEFGATESEPRRRTPVRRRRCRKGAAYLRSCRVLWCI